MSSNPSRTQPVHSGPESSDITLPQPLVGDIQPDDGPVDRGIQSSVGIRWLLLIGALIVSASLIRLVAEDWAAWPPALKALSLIAGSLGLFALGDFTHARLRLPTAGTALLALFSATMPVLAWGAHDRGLLDQPLGPAVFLSGTVAFLFATRRLMLRLFHYRGRLYPTVLAGLLLAVPLLPKLAAWRPENELLWIAGLLLVGGLLRIGSLHINRFFFHQDRAQGVDRPLHILPFGLLAVLFGGVVAALINGATELALPLILFAVVMIDTGEEYYRALVRSTGRVEKRWPRRSLGLLAIGFASLTLGLFLTIASEAPWVVAIGAAVSAWRLGSWALRYQKPVAYAGLLLCSWIAVLAFSIVAAPSLQQILFDNIFHWFFLAPLAFLVALAGLFSKSQVIDRRLKSVHAWVVTTLGMLLFSGLSLYAFLPSIAMGFVLLLLASAGFLRRNAPILGLWFVAFFSLIRIDMTATPRGLQEAWHLGLLALSAILVGIALKRRYTWLSRRIVAYPSVMIALILACASPFLWAPSQAAALMLLCAAIFFAAASWLGTLFELTTLSAWAAALLFAFNLGASRFSPWFAILSLSLLIAFWFGLRFINPTDHRRPALLLGCWIGVLTNFALLIIACLSGPLSIEPLIMVLVGSWGVHHHLRETSKPPSREVGMKAAFGLLLFFIPVQLTALVNLRPEIALLTIGATLFGADFAYRRLRAEWTQERRSLASKTLAFWTQTWLIASALACLVFAGPLALVLALAVTAAVVRQHKRTPSDLAVVTTFLPVLQLSLLGTDAGWLVEALRTPAEILPLFALIAFLWQLAIRRWAVMPQRREFGHVLDSLTLIICVAPFFFPLTMGQIALLFATALARSILHLHEAWRHGDDSSSWQWQGWLGTTVWLGMMAGWWSTSEIFLSYGALLVAVGQMFLAEIFARQGRDALRRPTLPIAAGFALVGGVHALANTLLTPDTSPWLALFPAFLASLFFLWTAIWNRWRVASAGLSVVFFALALNVLFVTLGDLPNELYLLGPGLALIGLSQLLIEEMGRRASQWVFSFGALLLYAIPVFGSLDGLSWGWQVMLLLLSVGFGALSFRLRSPSLLMISTGAACLALAFSVLKLRQDAPLVIWILGILLGLGLMATAAFLEHRREQLLQRLRIWGHELRAWA